MSNFKVGYFVGSLATASINRLLAKALVRLTPTELQMSEIPFKDLPLYSYDYDADYPPVAKAFKDAISAVDAVLFVTPEYNRSIPGALKNAIDWASRPYGDNAWDRKPVAIMGASIGATGSARAQYHLRQTFVYLDMYPLNKPEIMIAAAAQRFDERGHLVDEALGKRIEQLLVALVAWTRRLENDKGSAPATPQRDT